MKMPEPGEMLERQRFAVLACPDCGADAIVLSDTLKHELRTHCANVRCGRRFLGRRLELWGGDYRLKIERHDGPDRQVFRRVES